MRNLSLTYILLVYTCSAALITVGCGQRGLPKVTAGVDACDNCNMVIDKVNQACGYVIEGEFVPFDAPSCLINRLDEFRAAGERPPSDLYFADYHSTRLLPKDSVVFLLSTHLRTVMNSGVLCFSDRTAAQSLSKHDDEVITDWQGCFALKAEANRQIELSVTENGMLPEIIELQKGDVVAVTVVGQHLAADIQIRIKGYEDFSQVTVPATGEPVTFRLYANKPGAGFPMERSVDGQMLGMVKVAGPHTEEEEEM